MIMFKRGLKNNVKNELIRYEKTLENLRKFIEATIDLDDKLYEKIMNKRFTPRIKAKLNFDYNHREKQQFKGNTYNSNYQRSMFIKLNITQHNKEKNSKGKKSKKIKSYYSCDKSSHFAKNCRSKDTNLMQRRKINATLKIQFKE